VSAAGGTGAIPIPATAPDTPSAPTTIVSGTNIVVDWNTPSDNGAAITSYTIKIKQNDSIFSEELTSCDGTDATVKANTQCTIPIATLHASPFLLPELSTIVATVLAINSVGSSATSSQGGTAVIPSTATAPDTPVAPTTTILGSNVIVDWAAPSDNGAEILSYTIKIKQNDLSFTTELTSCDGTDATIKTNTQCTIPITTLQASPYSLPDGGTVVATVLATNSVGPSGTSSEGGTAVLPDVPDAPAAPTTTLSGSNIVVDWTAPNDNGATITSYTIKIKHNDLSFSTELTNCDGTVAAIKTNTQCTIPITTLQASPYSLPDLSTVKATVLATNDVGASATSSEGGTAVLPNTATAPDTPAAPTTTVSGSNIIVDWNAPSDNGATITSYTVKIK